MPKGRLITIEGLDGAGKTTLARALLAALAQRGADVTLLREPGGVIVAERIRALVKEPGLNIGARAEALLYAAARAQLVEETLAPLLEGGADVILDRFVDSSLAYQGGGRQLGVRAVQAINDFSTEGLRPDRTLLLVIEPAVGAGRSRHRGEALDRLELEEVTFHERTARAYLELAARDPDRIRQIDATRDPQLVLSDALAAIDDLF